MRHLIIIVLLACVISTHSAGRMVYVPSPTRALDKAAFERFVNNPDQWVTVKLRAEYFGPTGDALLFDFDWSPNGPLSDSELWVYEAAEVDQYFSERLAGRKDAIYPAYAKADVSPDGEGIKRFLLLIQDLNLFAHPLPCSICEKGWIDSKPELYKKGNEYFTLHIGFLSKERGSVEVEGHRVGGYIYYGGPTFMTDFPEPKNEEEKKALQGVREIIKYAKEKFIDYGMKNYWCKKEYRGGKVVSAVTGNQPVPKGKECKPNR
jgi:hypothetical protein